MRKRAVSLALCLCMVLSLLPLPVLAVGRHPFTDVAATDWFNDSVQYVYENGLMKGTSDTTFAPYRITQRGMIVTILYRLEGTPTVASNNPFTDVPRGSNYENAITWAAANGIVNGYDNATFGPYDNITRQQMAAILYRYAQRKGYRTSTSANLSGYTDSIQIGDYARTAMAWANGEGLINGNANKQLMPTGSATRAQTAAILTRFCQNVVPQQTPPVSLPIEEPEKPTQTTPQPVTPTSYTVTFDLNYSGGGVYQTSSVNAGEKVTAPTKPTRDKYTFLGWYTAATGGKKFNFNTAITAITTLYARWSKKSSSSGGGGSSTPAPTPTPPPVEKSAADTYYENNSQVVSVISAQSSNDVLTEADVKSMLAARGFIDYPITYEYSLDGVHGDETEITETSTVKHPMYQTFYFSDTDEAWVIYVINGKITANPVSFNLESDLDAELVVSETETLTSYVGEDNRFYVTIPNKSAIIVERVDRIDAETLNKLTIEEICKSSGATIPTSANATLDTADVVYSLAHDNVASLSAVTAQTDDDPIIVVSLGDSYSSGEGIEPFYGQEKSLREKVQDEDWLAHRSRKSWPSLLQVSGLEAGKTTGNYRAGESDSSICKWYFVAVSGAETKHFKNEQQRKKYVKENGRGQLGPIYLPGYKDMPKQLDIFNGLKGKVDYVTLTIGGNDVNFAGVIKQAVMGTSYLYWGSTTDLEDMLADLWRNIDSTMANIKQVYQDIEEAAGHQAAIIVAGYPKLLDKGGKGKSISKKEAKEINEKVTAFNGKIMELVAECQASGMNIHFVDVETEFDKDGGHQAFSDNAWINQIWLKPRPEDLDDGAIGSAYSVHPNEEGAKAYARCVNAKIEEIESSKSESKTISGVITIADTDTDMTNNVPLEGVEVAIENANFTKKIATTNSNGEYTLTDIPHGTFTITVSKEGYITTIETIVVDEDETEIIYNITIEAISNEYIGVGSASGTIYDALDGHAVSDLTLNIREGMGVTVGDIVTTIVTNSSGMYTLDNLQAGNYTVEVVDNRNLSESAERYYTTSFNIKILGNNSIPNQNGFVTNGLKANQLRIVLRWGSTPRDLDSHLVGPTALLGRFHTYYKAKNYYGSSTLMANLDLDDTSSYGPETTTIYEMSPGVYTFLVHDYSNSSSSTSNALARSGANVEVFLGNSPVAARTFSVPNNPGTVWAVFSYNSTTGIITPINQMSFQSNSDYVGSAYSVTGDVVLASVDSSEIPDVMGSENHTLKDYEISDNDNLSDELEQAA